MLVKPQNIISINQSFSNKQTAFFVLLLASFIKTHAQFHGGGGNRGGAQNMNMEHFYGKIVDANTNKPVEAASVQLLQNKLDSATKKEGT